MKSILLIGLGRFGKHLAKRLYELNHQIMAVDINEDRVNEIMPYAAAAQIGDSTDSGFLASLDIKSFDICIVAIGDDFQSSLETASLLKELGASRVIARAATDVHEKFLLRNGADEVIYPDKQIAAWAAIQCSSEHILDCIELGNTHSIYELTAPREWIGQTIEQLELRKRASLSIIGIKNNGELSTDISPSTIISQGSSVLVLGRTSVIQKTFRDLF